MAQLVLENALQHGTGQRRGALDEVDAVLTRSVPAEVSGCGPPHVVSMYDLQAHVPRAWVSQRKPRALLIEELLDVQHA